MPSPSAKELSETELVEVDKLMVCATITGAVLAMDTEVTKVANAKRKKAARL